MDPRSREPPERREFDDGTSAQDGVWPAATSANRGPKPRPAAPPTFYGAAPVASARCGRARASGREVHAPPELDPATTAATTRGRSSSAAGSPPSASAPAAPSGRGHGDGGSRRGRVSPSSVLSASGADILRRAASARRAGRCAPGRSRGDGGVSDRISEQPDPAPRRDDASARPTSDASRPPARAARPPARAAAGSGRRGGPAPRRALPRGPCGRRSPTPTAAARARRRRRGLPPRDRFFGARHGSSPPDAAARADGRREAASRAGAGARAPARAAPDAVPGRALVGCAREPLARFR